MKSGTWIQYGFIVGGLTNIIGIPIFSKFFANTYLLHIDPTTFSQVSLIAIMLWGFAYISVAAQVVRVPWIAVVFSVEKFFYTLIWAKWIWKHHTTLPEIYTQDWLTGFFYSVYGLNDFLFGVFFLLVFVHVRRATANSSNAVYNM